MRTLPGAALFDMDGLLIDSEPLWTVAEVELAERLGGQFSAELKAAIVGTRLEVAVPTILRWYDAPRGPQEVAATAAWLLSRMVELFSGEGLPVMPGAAELVASLRASGVPLALVSSSYRVLVDAVLARFPGVFAVTVAGDEVARGKPDPESYLLAAARLGVDPSRCVVLEDSPPGVAAGEAAGCLVVAVPALAGVHFAPAPRRLVANSLTEVDLGVLSRLLKRAA